MHADRSASSKRWLRWPIKLIALVAAAGMALVGCMNLNSGIATGQLLSTLALGTNAGRQVIAGTTLYVIDDQGLNVINVQDAVHPTLVSTLALPKTPLDMAISDTQVYLLFALAHNAYENDFADGSVGQTWLDKDWLTLDDPTVPFTSTINLVVLDMAAAVAPRHVAVLTEAQVGPVQGITIVDGLTIFRLHDITSYGAIERDTFLEVFDLTNVAQPQKLGRLPTTVLAWRLVPPYLYYTTGNSLKVVTLDPPLTEVSQFDAWSLGSSVQIWSVATSGQHAYASVSLSNGFYSTYHLVTLSLQDPAHPVEVAKSKRRNTTDHESDPFSVSVTKQGLFLIYTYGLVERLSLADPANPTLVAEYQTGEDTAEVLVVDDLLYVTGPQGLRIIRL